MGEAKLITFFKSAIFLGTVLLNTKLILYDWSRKGWSIGWFMDSQGISYTEDFKYVHEHE
jgi:hypothetical protein